MRPGSDMGDTWPESTRLACVRAIGNDITGMQSFPDRYRSRIIPPGCRNLGMEESCRQDLAATVRQPAIILHVTLRRNLLIFLGRGIRLFLQNPDRRVSPLRDKALRHKPDTASRPATGPAREILCQFHGCTFSCLHFFPRDPTNNRICQGQSLSFIDLCF